MEWSELVRRQPRLAALAERRLIEPGVVLVATIRRDGTPRLSPVEPLVVDGIYGVRTEGAVRAFQQQHGGVVDGIVGPATWQILRQDLGNVGQQRSC